MVMMVGIQENRYQVVQLIVRIVPPQKRRPTMPTKVKQTTWTEQMNEKAKKLIDDPEKYFKEARERNAKAVDEEKIPLRMLFHL